MILQKMQSLTHCSDSPSRQTGHALAARQFVQHILRLQALVRQQHQGMKPQIGDFVDDLFGWSSLAAITVSVASSPIFLQDGIGTLGDTAWRHRNCRAPPACAPPAFPSVGRRMSLISCKSRQGSFSTGIGRHPISSAHFLQFLKETARASGMTGDAAQLFNLQQDHVVVAIQADFFDLLHMAGLFALVPQFLARTRPVHASPRARGLLPAPRGSSTPPSALAGHRVLRNRRHQALTSSRVSQFVMRPIQNIAKRAADSA